jgi:hypothetical protein
VETKAVDSPHVALASVNSLGSDVTCQGVARTKLSPWSMWHKLNCFTAVTVCLSVALDPWETACFAHAATELIASHLSQIIIYAIQQRFLLLEPHTATALSALYSIGFYPFIKRYEQHVLRTLTLKNSAFCPQKVHKCII